jgi:hypothetical protein
MMLTERIPFAMSLSRAPLNTVDLEDDACEPDVCTHGRGFDETCVECCPEDDDGSFTGDEWS